MAQKHLKEFLAVAKDQVCRSKTTAAEEFCRALTAFLEMAMSGVPAGLHPSWLSKDVARWTVNGCRCEL